MAENTSYIGSIKNGRGHFNGIDYFRFIAALLIISIYTSPLSSVNETAEFILSRVIARTGVPFFFMTSGFFLISEYTKDNKRLLGFIKKTSKIYLISILIYIPLNIYNDYFKKENLLPEIVKDLVFDGTFYHLWYLPAAMLGGAIAWYVVKKQGYKRALIITGILYIIALFGDSYYGIAKINPVINDIYELMFRLFDYTRNGIFFAPFFFVLGGFIRDRQLKSYVYKKTKAHLPGTDLAKDISGFAASFILMLTEALILNYFEIQRHDSMYIFLPLCMYFLFNMLLRSRGGKGTAFIRDVSLVIYIIHPALIVVVRMLAHLLKVWEIMVDNSIIHYILVTVLSIIFSIVLVCLWRKSRRHPLMPQKGTYRAWIEINSGNLKHNVNHLKAAMHPESEIMAVVKTNAYGHGDFETASLLYKMGIRAFAAATIEEGIKLREYGILGEILILGYVPPYMAGELKKYDLTLTIIDINHARELNRLGIPVKCHIKIDTGMHRLGIPSEDTLEIEEVFAKKNLKVKGIYSHLCCSDNRNIRYAEFTRQQIDRFYSVIDVLREDGIKIPKLHIQSSYGLLNYPELKCDYVRLGIALYGVLSTTDSDTKSRVMLRPVLSLRSRVILIRRINRGESVGYNREFVAAKETLIAILPIGYGDGFPRNLSCQRSVVMIHGEYAPVVGRICMDHMSVDITEIENVRIGDEAVLIGEEQEGVNAAFVAENSGSISNELLCRMGPRLPVVVK